jgi:hypothetical protein
MPASVLSEALRLIQATPGYVEAGVRLAQLASDGRIRVDMDLEDRAQAGLLGIITLGPEAAEAGPVSLAQTLVHEYHHLHQTPLLKTVSFWSGVLTRTPVMRRYEQPAYQAAVDFLQAVKDAHPHLAEEAQAEQNAVRQVFAADFGEMLR